MPWGQKTICAYLLSHHMYVEAHCRSTSYWVVHGANLQYTLFTLWKHDAQMRINVEDLAVYTCSQLVCFLFAHHKPPATSHNSTLWSIVIVANSLAAVPWSLWPNGRYCSCSTSYKLKQQQLVVNSWTTAVSSHLADTLVCVVAKLNWKKCKWMMTRNMLSVAPAITTKFNHIQPYSTISVRRQCELWILRASVRLTNR